MSDRLVSTFYSSNKDKEAQVLSDGYGVYVIEYIEGGKVVTNQSFPHYSLHTVEEIAKEWVAK